LAEFLGEQHELLANAQVAKGPEVLVFWGHSNKFSGETEFNLIIFCGCWELNSDNKLMRISPPIWPFAMENRHVSICTSSTKGAIRCHESWASIFLGVSVKNYRKFLLGICSKHVSFRLVNHYFSWNEKVWIRGKSSPNWV
jgi:hypothetical protein